MKKLFLLMAIGSVALNAGAQERQISVRPSVPQSIKTMSNAEMRDLINHEQSNKSGAAKTTAGGGRWYNYADWLSRDADFNLSLGFPNDSLVVTAPYMWNNDKSQDIYAGTPPLDTNMFTSLGVVLAPQWIGYNNGKYYATGTMAIGPGDAYVVDSIAINGFYGTNPARIAAGVKDTLRIVVVHGQLGPKASNDIYSLTLSTAHYGSITMADAFYDSLNNRGVSKYGSTELLTVVMNKADTLPNGQYYKVIPLASTATYGGTGVVNCAANDFVGVTVSFKSGDATFVNYDTVFRGSPFVPAYKYNMFRPFVSAISTAGTIGWPYYSSANYNIGLFKVLPDTAQGWGKEYIPTFAWGVTSPASYQSPFIPVHLTCASCAGTITDAYLSSNNVTTFNKVTASPNPAKNELSISYTLSNVSDVNVTLTNMLGQVVASSKVNGASSGKVSFNTELVPAGVYVYTLEANGERSTGRVAVAH